MNRILYSEANKDKETHNTKYQIVHESVMLR